MRILVYGAGVQVNTREMWPLAAGMIAAGPGLGLAAAEVIKVFRRKRR